MCTFIHALWELYPPACARRTVNRHCSVHIGKESVLEHSAGLTRTAVGLPFITGIFTSALFPPRFPKQNLTMMPTCAAPHAPAVPSITKCTPSSPAVLLAPVLPDLDLPTYSRKVVQRAYAGRQIGEGVEEKEFIYRRQKESIMILD